MTRHCISAEWSIWGIARKAKKKSSDSKWGRSNEYSRLCERYKSRQSWRFNHSIEASANVPEKNFLGRIDLRKMKPIPRVNGDVEFSNDV